MPDMCLNFRSVSVEASSLTTNHMVYIKLRETLKHYAEIVFCKIQDARSWVLCSRTAIGR